MSRQLAELLLKDKIITAAQFAEAEAVAKVGKSYVRYLIEKKFVAEPKLLYYLSQKFGLPSINLSKFEVSQEVLQLLAPDSARFIVFVFPMVGGTYIIHIGFCPGYNACITFNNVIRVKVLYMH